MTKLTRRSLLSTGTAAATVGVATAVAGRPAIAAGAINWRFQTLWQPGTANQLAFERFADSVREMTDGEINITVLSAGAVVGVTEMVDGINQRILDGMHSAVVYWTGLNPVFAALGDLNGAYDSAYIPMEYFSQFGGLELLREAYKPLGLYPIGVAWWGAESIPTKRRVAGVADLEGLKMRLPQGMSSDLFQKFGAVAVNLPGTEVFSALDNGTIDATDWGTLNMNNELGFTDMAKFAIYPGIHSTPTGDVTIRLEDWEALSPRNQKILEQAVSSFNLDMLQTLSRQDLEQVQLMEGEGVELVDWSTEERRKFRAAAVEVWQDYASKNDITKRAIDGQIDYLRMRGLID